MTPFEDILHIDNLNGKVELFNTMILNIFDVLAPIRSIQTKKYRPPWLTDNIRLMMKLRDKALAKFKKTKNPHHWEYYKN